VQKHTKLFFRLCQIHYFKFSHVVPKFLFFFLGPATFQYNTLTFAVFVNFFACALRSLSSLLCSPLHFFSGSHFLCPSTFFFLLFPFPLSPSPIPPPAEKSRISPSLHSISTVIFLYPTFTLFVLVL
jgi:hypothetical protein